jgi:glycosyltransferase involved in cell wall biosynthesis
VTKNRPRLAKVSISCFLKQIYQQKELVIIDDGESTELAEFVRQLNHPQITHYHLPNQNLTLGELRNISIAKATGSYLAQWDDDDLSDPLRLELQMGVIRTLKVDSCLLNNVYIWWPHQQRLVRSVRRTWEGTLVCRKQVFPTYPSLRRGEDTEVVQSLSQNHQIVAIDRPDLYLYCIHEHNTWDTAHFDDHWHHAQTRFEHDTYLEMLEKLAQRLPMATYLRVVQSIEANQPKIASYPDRIGINIAGFVDEGYGISEGTQCCLSALAANQIPHVINQIEVKR